MKRGVLPRAFLLLALSASTLQGCVWHPKPFHGTPPAEPPAGQDVIRPWSRPLYAQGHLAILRGNLATEGAVAKVTGVKHPVMTGPARVFDREEACIKAIFGRQIRPGDVVIIRYEGPKGGPGMREIGRASCRERVFEAV